MIFKFNKNNNKDTKNEKKQIWMYAVILFTGAFIILLLTAYSQLKFQNNINDYQNKLSTEEKAKINVVTNLNSAIKENERLKKELEEFHNKLVESEQNLATLEERNTELESKISNSIDTTDLLLKAYENFEQGDFVNSAIILKYDINKQYLSGKAIQSYDDLVKKTYQRACKILYLEGYRNYKNNNYIEAIINFNRVIDLSQKNEYFIDDTYFYLANSYYRTADFDAAKQVILYFKDNYSESPLIKDINKLLNKVG